MQFQIHFCCRRPASLVCLNDAWSNYDHVRTVDKVLVDVSAEIKAPPKVAGGGNVHSLRQAGNDALWGEVA